MIIKWTAYIVWFLIWFCIISFLAVPIKPLAVAGGALTVTLFYALIIFSLIHGFRIVNKYFDMRFKGDIQFNNLERTFVMSVIVLSTITFFKIFYLIYKESSSQINSLDSIDPQTGEKIDHPMFFGPKNYWECILDEMPGTQNDVVARSLVIQCSESFPAQLPIEGKYKVGGFFSVPTKEDCLIEHAKDTPSQFAAKVIYSACYELYY